MFMYLYTYLKYVWIFRICIALTAALLFTPVMERPDDVQLLFTPRQGTPCTAQLLRSVSHRPSGLHKKPSMPVLSHTVTVSPWYQKLHPSVVSQTPFLMFMCASHICTGMRKLTHKCNYFFSFGLLYFYKWQIYKLHIYFLGWCVKSDSCCTDGRPG